MPNCIKQAVKQKSLSSTLADLLPELLVFLRKSGVGKEESGRYKKSLESLFEFVDEQGLDIKAVHTEAFRQEYFQVDGTRKARHLKKLLSFLDYIDFSKRVEVSTGRGMPLEKTLAEFLEHLEIRKYKKKTIENYRFIISGFIVLCKELGITRVDSLSKRAVEKYLNLVFIKEKDRYCLNKKIHILYELRTFLRYLFEVGHTLVNLGMFIEVPRQDKKITRNYFKQEEIVKIFAAINSNTIFGFMDRVLFEFLYGTGIRINELCGILTEDVDLIKKTLLIREGKGGKERVVPLTRMCLKYLAVYLDNVRPRIVNKVKEHYGFSSSDYLFLSIKGRRLLGKNMSVNLQKYMRSAGITQTRTCHAFRYSAATHMLENGADIRYISDLLGHNNLNTTGEYTRASTGNLLESIALHPRAEVKSEISFKGKRML
ncbi:MAG: tyrosine-type recombinase/integrase [Candidatus Peribacteraceae bacterium]|nr:tyrosine-type recombinase/integrase [Candidatus Peribacteraceae bacterium]